MIIKLISAGAQDDVLKNARFLRDKTAQMIFETGGNEKVYKSAIWPRPVFDLLRAATVKARAINSLRSTQIGSSICAKGTQPFIKIRTTDDLDKLPAASSRS